MTNDIRNAADVPQLGSAASPFSNGPATAADPGGDTAVLLLIDVAAASRLWGYGRFIAGAAPVRREPGVRFAKQLGTGYEGGFGLRPSGTRQGLFVLFDGEAAADAFLASSDLARRYRENARELCIVKARPYRVRGSWDGFTPRVGGVPPADGPVAALTRASIRPGRAHRFWPNAGPSQDSLERAAGCQLAVGLGEAPVLRQATFSIWENVAAMDAYARTGAHQRAIVASRDFFSESMFVRFAPQSITGVWKGRRYG
ncbi:spheroidene monooxygenase [Rubrivivax gelatinosus]|uniref:spheroidene monooxygenase n=1 Tax=Rubrivivax gelatinosus TaxID=28068 RepID=UPI001908C7ED|nr:spheroidene monooxygenase [Rubrivivax gelatinosus]MBK1612504.1 spheroidene monooxygenase [Rubrivivax gelatinosus]